MNFFDLLKSISFTKIDLSEHEDFEKLYEPYMINLYLSHSPDTLYIANELAKHKNISKKNHYLFCLKMIHKKNRFFKYIKQNIKHEDIQHLINHFQVNKERAIEYSELLDSKVINKIKQLSSEQQIG